MARAYAKTVTQAIFGKGAALARLRILRRSARGVTGVTEAQISAASSDKAAKQAVVSAVDLAKADGMIGALFIVLEGEPFWGADRREQLGHRLAKGH